MSKIQLRKPEKKAESHVNLNQVIQRKPCSTAHLPFLSSDPKTLKAFQKTFPNNIKPTYDPAEGTKMRHKKWKKRGGEKGCCVFFKSS